MNSDDLGQLIPEKAEVLGYSEDDALHMITLAGQHDHAYVDQGVTEEPTASLSEDGTVVMVDQSEQQLTTAAGLIPVIIQGGSDSAQILQAIPVIDPGTNPDLVEALQEGAGESYSQAGHVQLVNGVQKMIVISPEDLPVTEAPTSNVLEPPTKKQRTSEKNVKPSSGVTSNKAKKTMKMTLNGSGDQRQVRDTGDKSDGEEELANTDISQAWFTTRLDKIILHNKGIQWRQGQWSRDEVELLENNIAVYCQEREIENPADIIFNMSKDERKDFYRTVAQGLQRPLFSVYRRVIRMYDQKNHIGKYKTEEINALKKLREVHGTDWAAIGAALGRSASSVKDRCRLMRDTCNSGKWLPEEERRLAQAVYDLSGVPPGMQVTQGLSWSLVAERVATRTEKQCRTKWLNYLNWKNSGGVEWTREDDIKLIKRLTDLGVEDDTQVDWSTLAAEMKSARSPQWLRGKWWTIKRHVANYQQLTLKEILEALKQLVMLDIRTKLPISTTLNAAANGGLQPTGNVTLSIPINTLTTEPVASSSQEDKPLVMTQPGDMLHSLVPVGSGGQQLLLAPDNQGLNMTSLTEVTGAGEHIIVHMMPVTQLGAENVSVEMTPQVIIAQDEQLQQTTADHMDLELVTNSQHTDLQVLTDIGQDIASPSVINEDISQSHLISHQTDFHKTQGLDAPNLGDISFQVTVPGDECDAACDVSGASEIIPVSQDNACLMHNLSSLTDPMLTSDTSLLCSNNIKIVKGDEVTAIDSEGN